jgi:hypothetical protein
MSLTTRQPSLTALRRAEKETYRECCELYRTLLKLDASHADDTTYLQVYALYQAASDAHFAACDALNAHYDKPDTDPEPTPPAGALRPDFADVYAEDVYGRLAA